MDFPRPPPPLNGNCNDLLRRVGDFLPKIKEANQELDDSDTKQQIDATLVEDKEEDDSDEESDSQNELSSAPTIELKVALGKLCENPGISALLDADKDTEGEEQTTKVTLNDSEETEKVNSHEKAVSEVTDQGKQNVATSTTSKKRKALIQELS